MKTISLAVIATFFLIACNNNAESDKDNTIDPDSFNTSEKRDVNNMNTTVYDSTPQTGDTSSYERMPDKVKDSIPQ